MMNGKMLCLAAVCALATAAGARDRRNVTVAVDVGADAAAETVAFVKKNALGYKAAGHPVAYAETRMAGGGVRITVTDPNGAVVYGGGDKNAAIVALADTLASLPAPGELIGGVVLKKFKAYRKKLVMGVKAEGAALAPYKAALKSKKPAEAEEARAILDAIENAKKTLAQDIQDDLAEGDKGMALRDIRWYITTWPSERKTYDAEFKRLSADPEAVKAEKDWFAAQKKRR